MAYNIALIGCGKMGGSMLRSWIENDLISHCYITGPHGIPEEFSGIDYVSHCDAQELIKRRIDVIVIAVKPQILEDACAPVAKAIDGSVPVVSIAAGKSLDKLKECFSVNTPIIRTMPNTPAAIGKGVCVAIKNDHISDEQKLLATTLLSVTGLVEWIEDENLMDAVTALSGSGPAYIFHLIEVMANAGEKAGLSKDMAMTLARQTVVGSASLAEHYSDTPASTLRENVTSPNGTTYAALQVLMDGRMEKIFEDAVCAARDRSRELNS